MISPFLIFLAAFPLLSYQLHSERADYNGKTLTLTGNFQIDHPMGSLNAEKATLENIELRSSLKAPALLSLEGNVRLDRIQGEPPFSIRSKKAFCEIPSHFSLLSFQPIHFFDHVEIETVQGLKARGSNAIYRGGSMTLYPSIPTLYCQISKGEDKMEAIEMTFDFLNERIACKEPRGFLSQGSLQFSSQKLLWDKKEGELFLERNVRIQNGDSKSELFILEADSGHLDFTADWEPGLAQLEGNVRLIASPRVSPIEKEALKTERQSFALAEKVRYCPIEKVLTLTSASPKRVLFWQEGLSLSAPELILRQDEGTNKESVEGKGDVHFTFDLEEQKSIEQLISKYL